jgi:F-type H+-transporting ATPase subunit b
VTRRLHAATLSFSRVLLVALLLCSPLAFSQASTVGGEQANGAEQNQVTDRPVDFGTQLAHQSREAAGEEKGENDELKKSPAVRMVARATGMTLQHAYWLCMLLNFVIIAVAIVWMSRLHLPGIFRSRTQSIRSAMEEASKASEDANRRLAEIESRLSRLDSEIATMQSSAEQEAVAEEARMQAAMEEDRRKIVETAQQEIEAAAKAARRDLKVYAADLAVAMAQRQIRVDNLTDQVLVRSFAEELGSEVNGSGKDGH